MRYTLYFDTAQQVGWAAVIMDILEDIDDCIWDVRDAKGRKKKLDAAIPVLKELTKRAEEALQESNEFLERKDK